jgi:hypothetical protein
MHSHELRLNSTGAYHVQLQEAALYIGLLFIICRGNPPMIFC